MIDTNLTGVFFCCRAAIPHLKQRGGGWIVNISSLASQNPFAGGACYSATKAGLNAFSHALMQEVRAHDIRVTVVAPGSVNTSFIPRGGPSPATRRGSWRPTTSPSPSSISWATPPAACPAWSTCGQRSRTSRARRRPARAETREPMRARRL